MRHFLRSNKQNILPERYIKSVFRYLTIAHGEHNRRLDPGHSATLAYNPEIHRQTIQRSESTRKRIHILCGCSQLTMQFIQQQMTAIFAVKRQPIYDTQAPLELIVACACIDIHKSIGRLVAIASIIPMSPI